MTRLYVVAEGATEFNFVQQILKPHLEHAFPAHFVTAVRHKEGFKYVGVQKDVRQLLGRPGSQVVVTTMIDLYGIPRGFPELRESETDPSRERVRKIEKEFARDIDDARFIPYIQLHEFEALVLCGLSLLEEQHPDRRMEIRKLDKQVGRFSRGSRQSPSQRILQAIPGYAKIVDGIQVVKTVGIETLRQKCLHFGEWLQALERVLSTAH